MRRAVLGFACAAAAAVPSHASIVSTTGAALQIAPPADARQDVLTSNTTVYCWNEDQNVLLGAPLHVNAAASGLYNDLSLLGDIPIPAGWRVSSHYIHFDAPPPDDPSTALGTVTFDEDIIGVMCLGDGGPTFLDDSDFLGSSTLYEDGLNARGMELTINGEFFQISPSHKTIQFRFQMSNPGDFIRVVTRPVPAPGALGVLGGVCALVGARRRRA